MRLRRMKQLQLYLLRYRLRLLFVLLFQKNIHMQKLNSSYSRSNSTRSHHRPSITYQTILKRRNDTIPSKQLYEQSLNSAHTRSLTKSTIIEPQTHQQPPSRQLDIRQYIKKMGVKRVEPEKIINDRRHTQIDDEVRSQRSIHSMVSTYSQAKQLKPIQVKVPKTIEQLENKIESLITQSMQILRKQRSNIGLNKWAQIRKASSLDQDFRQIETYYSELKVQIEESEHSSQKLADLNKKIELLEKMMASQSVQSELLRQQYFNWKNQRTNTTSFSSKRLLGNVSMFNKDLKAFNPKNQNVRSQSKQTVIKLDSTSQVFFKKPGKEYYIGIKQKKNSYSVNRQPMERSSYSTQFLNYGYVPTYTHKIQNVPQMGGSLAVKASSYQQEYKEKLGLSKNISMKELDCYRDKFKNPNISFMNHSKKMASQNTLKKSQKPNQKENSCQVAKKFDPSLLSSMNATTSADFYKSEHNSNYIWHNTMAVDSVRKEDILKSEIKDKRLGKMKDAFKALAMRR